jgi:ribose/xylose/arabinose/galactoside ABC-type transport system permease subunit
MVSPAKLPDDRIVRIDLLATAAFTIVQVLAAALPDTFSVVSVPVSLALFVVGAVAFLWGFLVGVGRSQYEVVTLGGLFFLGEATAPADVRRALRVLLAVQVLVAVVAASVRPFSELAFGILVPMLGLGMITLWAARHGAFAPKDADDKRAEDRPRPGSPRQ